jgi:XamI restriction endonuclease
MNSPRLWTVEELERDRQSAIAAFRRERLEEPLEEYLQAFDTYERVIEDLLEATGDLARLDDSALDLLIDRRLAEALRYLTGPIISTDDLKTTADAALSPARLRADPAMVERIVTLIRAGVDRRRFAWLPEHRDPSKSERHAAIVASAALMANSRVGTTRRNKGRLEQETAVLEALTRHGLKQVARRLMTTIHQAPKPGELCLESHLGSAKADLVVSLWDRRVMPIECKVSNSAVNSVKRLNREAAAKAEAWTNDFGTRQVVPVAVLSGVYKLGNLLNAQERGLHLFWAHSLGALTSWIDSTRPGA